MADIFLSYTEKDREIVRRLAGTLQSVGWSVWWDRRIPAGLTWRSVLDAELSTMRCMVVLWSADSVRSEWVCEEASEGRRLGRLVPASIDSVRPPAGFREVQAADLVGWDGSPDFIGLQRLIEDIERLIGKPDNPAAAESRPVPGSGAAGNASAHGQSAEPDRPGHLQPLRDPRPAPWTLRKLAPWLGGALLASVVAGSYLGLSQTHRGDGQDDARTAPGARATVDAPIGNPPPVADANAPQPTGATALPTTTPLSTPPRVVAAKPVAPQQRPASERMARPASVSARCVALRERLELGEQLSTEARSFLNQECQ